MSNEYSEGAFWSALRQWLSITPDREFLVFHHKEGFTLRLTIRAEPEWTHRQQTYLNRTTAEEHLFMLRDQAGRLDTYMRNKEQPNDN